MSEFNAEQPVACWWWLMNELHYCLLGFTPRRSFLLHSVNPTPDCITGCGNMTRPPLTAGPSHHTPSTSSTPQLMSLPVWIKRGRNGGCVLSWDSNSFKIIQICQIDSNHTNRLDTAPLPCWNPDISGGPQQKAFRVIWSKSASRGDNRLPQRGWLPVTFPHKKR